MATTYACPKGHDSLENDFCSECGAKIQTGAAAIADVAAPGATCPDCHAPVPAGGVNFCEICGYNFVTHTSGQFPPVAAQPAVTPQAPAPPDPAPAVQPTAVLTVRVVVAVDPSLRTAASPETPADFAPVTYLIEKPTSLIGRNSEARAVFPEIPLDHDVAVSHRHGMISQSADGQLTYRDLGSSNGTKLNGTELAALTETPLKAGDQLTLGHWTRITVEAR